MGNTQIMIEELAGQTPNVETYGVDIPNKHDCDQVTYRLLTLGIRNGKLRQCHCISVTFGSKLASGDLDTTFSVCLRGHCVPHYNDLLMILLRESSHL